MELLCGVVSSSLLSSPPVLDHLTKTVNVFWLLPFLFEIAYLTLMFDLLGNVHTQVGAVNVPCVECCRLLFIGRRQPETEHIISDVTVHSDVRPAV